MSEVETGIGGSAGNEELFLAMTWDMQHSVMRGTPLVVPGHGATYNLHKQWNEAWYSVPCTTRVQQMSGIFHEIYRHKDNLRTENYQHFHMK
jgi:hypothetical protein